MNTPVIRAAASGDARQIAEVQVDSWRTTYVGLVPDSHLAGLSVPARETVWIKVLTDINQAIFVAENEGVIQGFVNVGPCRDPDKNPRVTGEVYAIYLRQNAQGAGLGRELWERATGWLKEHGFKELTVLVLRENELARGFYEKMDLRPDGFEKPAQIGDQAVVELRYTQRVI